MAYSSNTLITPTLVANMALARLKNNLVYPNLVHRDFSGDFANRVGETVNVRIPASLTAYKFSSTITTQDTTESYVAVKLNKLADVSPVITSKEWTLSVKDFEEQIVGPAIDAIAQMIDLDIASTLFGNATSTVSETVSAQSSLTLTNIANVAKALDTKKAPNSNRRLVMSPYHKYRYGLVDNLAKAAYAGDSDMLRRADLGLVFGMDTFMDQNTPSSTAATSGSSVTTISVASSSDAGEVDLTAGLAATGTFAVGDGFVYVDSDGFGTLYRFTEVVTLSSNAASSKTVSPTFPANISATSCYIVRNGSSLGFHKDACAFVTRPLELPQGAARAYVASADGFSVRVVFDYNPTYKYDIISFDVLYGVKMLRNDLAVRLVDGTLA